MYAGKAVFRRQDEGLGPVSYTHLDVYKRQIQARPPAKQPFRAVPRDPAAKAADAEMDAVCADGYPCLLYTSRCV